METKSDFIIDLQFSLDSSNEQFINEAYKRIFLHVIDIQTIKDIELQKQGVDKKIILDGGKYVLIDEKIRRRWYGDILLEEYSDYDHKIRGWLFGKKQTDYISYIILPTNTLFLFPFLLLQKVWVENYKIWLLKFGRKFAINKTWRTSNIAIPVNILLDKIKESMINKL